jgi:hypothetical protein
MGFVKKKTHPADEKHNVITEREHGSSYEEHNQ